jgi:hypothetical protein
MKAFGVAPGGDWSPMRAARSAAKQSRRAAKVSFLVWTAMRISCQKSSRIVMGMRRSP